MRYLCILFFLFGGSLQAQPDITWQKEFGGDDDDWANDVVESGDGNFVFAGFTASSDGDIVDSLGLTDVWLVKFSSDSTIIWQSNIGGTENERAFALCQSPDGGFAFTGFSTSSDVDIPQPNMGFHDLLVGKTDASGNLLWLNTYGGTSSEEGHDITPTPDGGYLIVGHTFSSDNDVSENKGLSDYWLLKIDAGGNLLWEKTFGGSSEDRARSITPTQDGGYLLNGTAFSPDGDVSTPLGGVDVWLVKVDAQGNFLWEKSLGGSAADQGQDALESTTGDLVIVGETLSNDGDVQGNHGLTDAWIIRLDASGNLLWQNSLGGTMVDYFLGVAEDADGGFVAVGQTFSSDGDVSTNIGDSDIWLAKVTATGDFLWEISLGNIRNELASGLLISGDDIIVTGTAEADESRHGDTNAYTAKLRNFVNSSIPIGNSISIKIHPNPSMETLWVQSESPLYSCTLYNMHGQSVRTLHPYGQMRAGIPVKGLPAGQYLLITETAGGKYSSKIQIVR